MKAFFFPALAAVVLCVAQVGCAARGSIRTGDTSRKDPAVQVGYTTGTSAKSAAGCESCPACPARK